MEKMNDVWNVVFKFFYEYRFVSIYFYDKYNKKESRVRMKSVSYIISRFAYNVYKILWMSFFIS